MSNFGCMSGRDPVFYWTDDDFIGVFCSFHGFLSVNLRRMTQRPATCTGAINFTAKLKVTNYTTFCKNRNKKTRILSENNSFAVKDCVITSVMS